jgi:protein phosphatase
LSGYVNEREIAEILLTNDDPEEACEKLIQASLSEGAPDNVTAVIVHTAAGRDTSPPREPIVVGSAAGPITYQATPVTKAPRLPALLLHPLRAVDAADEHFEPEEGYLEELIEEDRRRARRRKITWSVGVIIVIAALTWGVIASYQWTQTRYFVGEVEGQVMIFQGVQQNIGPFSLSTPYEATGIEMESLPQFLQESVQETLPAENLDEARDIVQRLTRD